jgi:hypothetical protein
MDDLDGFFDDHGSLSASLDDFAHDEAARGHDSFHSPLIPSMNRSGFAGAPSDKPASEASGSAPSSPWPSEGWRRRSFIGTSPTGMWLHHQPYLQKDVRDRLDRSTGSPGKRARSDSPAKGRWTGSPAPSRHTTPLHYEDAEEGDITLTSRVHMRHTSPLKSVSPGPKPESSAERDFEGAFEDGPVTPTKQTHENTNNNCESLMPD